MNGCSRVFSGHGREPGRILKCITSLRNALYPLQSFVKNDTAALFSRITWCERKPFSLFFFLFIGMTTLEKASLMMNLARSFCCKYL